MSNSVIIGYIKSVLFIKLRMCTSVIYGDELKLFRRDIKTNMINTSQSNKLDMEMSISV